MNNEKLTEQNIAEENTSPLTTNEKALSALLYGYMISVQSNKYNNFEQFLGTVQYGLENKKGLKTISKKESALKVASANKKEILDVIKNQPEELVKELNTVFPVNEDKTSPINTLLLSKDELTNKDSSLSESAKNIINATFEIAKQNLKGKTQKAKLVKDLDEEKKQEKEKQEKQENVNTQVETSPKEETQTEEKPEKDEKEAQPVEQKSNEENKEQAKPEAKSTTPAQKNDSVDLSHISKALSIALFMFGFFTGCGGLLLLIIAMGLGSEAWATTHLNNVGKNLGNSNYLKKAGVELDKPSKLTTEQKTIQKAIDQNAISKESGEKIMKFLEIAQKTNPEGLINKTRKEINNQLEKVNLKVRQYQIAVDKYKNSSANKLIKASENLKRYKELQSILNKKSQEFETIVKDLPEKIKDYLSKSMEYASDKITLKKINQEDFANLEEIKTKLISEESALGELETIKAGKTTQEAKDIIAKQITNQKLQVENLKNTVSEKTKLKEDFELLSKKVEAYKPIAENNDFFTNTEKAIHDIQQNFNGIKEEIKTFNKEAKAKEKDDVKKDKQKDKQKDNSKKELAL